MLVASLSRKGQDSTCPTWWPPVRVALKTDQLQLIYVTLMLDVLGGLRSKAALVSTMLQLCENVLIHFFLKKLLPSMNYLFLFKAYLSADSSLSLLLSLSSNILPCFLVLDKGCG